MASQPDTETGTVTLTAGVTGFTTTGVQMLTRGHLLGDTFLLPNGKTLKIALITGENAGNLKFVCPADCAGTFAVNLRYQADGSRIAAQTRNLIDVLGNGNLQAEANIDGTGGNWLSYFTGAGTKARTAFLAWGRSLLGLTMAADKVPYGVDANTMALMTVTAQARALLDDADAATMRGTLGAQPLDSDLTAIASLSTTEFGRSLLTQADLVAALATLNAVQQGGGIGQLANRVQIGWADGNILKATIGGSVDIGALWTDHIATKLLAANGYQRLPSGLILQWGTGSGSPGTITFPTGFPTLCTAITANSNFNAAANELISILFPTITTTGATFLARYQTGAITANTATPFKWMAMGY